MNPIAHYFQTHSSPLAPIPTALEAVLPALTDIKCVAFDIYGTLVISGSGDIGLSDAEHRSELLCELLREAGATAIPENAADCFVGLVNDSHEASRAEGVEFPEVDILEIWEALLTTTKAPPAKREVLELLAARYELATNPVWPMPGARELISELRERGVRLGIVSNAQFYTPHLFEGFWGQSLEALGFDPDLCFYSYQSKQAKPGTWLYQQLRDALGSLDITPEETLYLGNDALKDVHPAGGLGFKTALFAGDQRSLRLREERPDLHPPDAVVTDLRQITRHLLPPLP